MTQQLLTSPGHGTSRFIWESQTRPLVESVLKQAFPKTYGLRWTADSPAELQLDREHGIDLILAFTNQQELSFQAKVLSTDYKTITIESQSSHDNSLGDWSTCRADFILVAYCPDGQSISRYALLNRVALTLATMQGRLTWSRRNPSLSSRHKSSFHFIELSDIQQHAPECLVQVAGDWATEP